MGDTAAARWRIEPLSDSHDREAVDCEEQELNDFLRKYALQNQVKGVGKTFVAVKPDRKRVDGYYTLSVGCVQASTMAPADRKLLPSYPVPVAHLGGLAVDKDSRKQGLGETLLMHALRNVARASMQIGIHSLEVCAMTEKARSFYRRYGFREFQDEHLHLYLPLDEVLILGNGEAPCRTK